MILSKVCSAGLAGRRASSASASLLGRSFTGHVTRSISGKSHVQQWAATTAAAVPDHAYEPLSTNYRSGQLPSSPAQVNVLEQLFSPAYYDTVAKVMKIRERYIRDRHVFVESDAIIPILKGLGAKEEDLSLIQTVSDSLPLDPTLPFRESKNGRFCFDFDKQSIRRLEFQPFALSVTEDFKRHDSDQVRRFEEIGNDLQLNSVFQALMLFKSMVLHGVNTRTRPNLNYSVNRWICTVFNLRTITTPELVGEPALEGVHTDGVDHTMTTFIGSNNMNAKSCVTAMHDNAEETGVAMDRTQPLHLTALSQHRNLLDTLIIADNERKHSISPLVPADMERRATRDMLIFFTRKPATKGHVSEHIDSTTSHQELPMEIPLWLPN